MQSVIEKPLRIAVDIDGTLTAYPVVLTKLITVVKQAGGFVVLLTGGLADNSDEVDIQEWIKVRRRQVLATCPSLVDVDIVPCPGRDGYEVAELKAAYIKDNKIDLFIDDSSVYCDTAHLSSPATLVVKVIA